MSEKYSAGVATAYGAALRGGYTGTYNDFCNDVAKLGNITEELGNISAEATTLEAGSSATASYNDGVFTFGIPRGNTGAQGERGETGAKGDKGDTGETGATGATGNGIASITKTGTSGLVDTYTITFTDETTTTFTVTNGAEAIDATLSIAGRAADAKATGDAVNDLKSELNYNFPIQNAMPLSASNNVVNGVSFTYSNGILTPSGTATANGGRLAHLVDLPNLKAGTYTISAFLMGTGIQLQLHIQNSSNSIVASVKNGSSTFTLNTDADLYIGASVDAGKTYQNPVGITLVAGSTAPSEFVDPRKKVVVDDTAREGISNLQADFDGLVSDISQSVTLASRSGYYINSSGVQGSLGGYTLVSFFGDSDKTESSGKL